MLTFVEASDHSDDDVEGDEEEIVFVPYVKPPPPFISLVESDGEAVENVNSDDEQVNEMKNDLKRKSSPVVEDLEENQARKKAKTTPEIMGQDPSRSPSAVFNHLNGIGGDIKVNSDLNQNQIVPTSSKSAGVEPIENELNTSRSSKSTSEEFENNKNLKTTSFRMSIGGGPGWKFLADMETEVELSDTPVSPSNSVIVLDSESDAERCAPRKKISIEYKRKQRKFSNIFQKDSSNVLKEEEGQDTEAVKEEEKSQSNSQHSDSVFPQSWTLDMKQFYGEICSSKFSMKTTLRKQSNNRKNWSTPLDEYGCRPSQRRNHIKCLNCSQWGHHLRDCPEKFKGLICFVCGAHGTHTQPQCPNTLCINCGSKQSKFQRTCSNCSPRGKSGGPLAQLHCNLCDGRGHVDATCPDLWRRYHATTIVQHIHEESDENEKDMKRTRSVYKLHQRPSSELQYKDRKVVGCCNCGSSRHNYFRCKGPRNWDMVQTPHTPYIIDTSLSVDVLRMDEMLRVMNNEPPPSNDTNDQIMDTDSSNNNVPQNRRATKHGNHDTNNNFNYSPDKNKINNLKMSKPKIKRYFEF